MKIPLPTARQIPTILKAGLAWSTNAAAEALAADTDADAALDEADAMAFDGEAAMNAATGGERGMDDGRMGEGVGMGDSVLDRSLCVVVELLSFVQLARGSPRNFCVDGWCSRPNRPKPTGVSFFRGRGRRNGRE